MPTPLGPFKTQIDIPERILVFDVTVETLLPVKAGFTRETPVPVRVLVYLNARFVAMRISRRSFCEFDELRLPIGIKRVFFAELSGRGKAASRGTPDDVEEIGNSPEKIAIVVCQLLGAVSSGVVLYTPYFRGRVVSEEGLERREWYTRLLESWDHEGWLSEYGALSRGFTAPVDDKSLLWKEASNGQGARAEEAPPGWFKFWLTDSCGRDPTTDSPA
ncbi:hypothetical protein BJV78DRAFT_1151545 [Lactifluus subvellereus]|nr:hypothetical protein BJV78DRAFT_1151545 [Lactifluus subvellereus]